MKSALSYILMLVALTCIYAFNPVVSAGFQNICTDTDDSQHQFIEAVSDFHAVAPTQNPLTVRTCHVGHKNLFNGFFEVLKSTCKVFFNTFSSSKVNPAGFVIKFCKFDISFPFNSFW